MKIAAVKKLAQKAFIAGHEESSFAAWWKLHGPKLRKCNYCGETIEPDEYVGFYGMPHHKECADLRESQS